MSANQEEIEKLRRAVWRLSGSGMSQVQFWRAYGDKLDTLTKTEVSRAEALRSTPVEVEPSDIEHRIFNVLTHDYPAPYVKVQALAKKLAVLYAHPLPNPSPSDGEVSEEMERLRKALRVAVGALRNYGDASGYTIDGYTPELDEGSLAREVLAIIDPILCDGIPPEIGQQIEDAKPAIDLAERFIAAVIEAEGSDWYRENDEGGLLLCHTDGAYFDVFSAMRTALQSSKRGQP